MSVLTRPLRLGDRVRLNDGCAWESRVGLLGVVADSSPGYDSVYVLLDDDSSPSESQWPESGGRLVRWSCSTLESSLDLLEAVEQRLALTPFQLQVWQELEESQSWEQQGDGQGNWEPWQRGWLTPHSSAQSRALGILADHGLVARKPGRALSKIPDQFRPLAWDPRQAPAPSG